MEEEEEEEGEGGRWKKRRHSSTPAPMFPDSFPSLLYAFFGFFLSFFLSFFRVASPFGSAAAAAAAAVAVVAVVVVVFIAWMGLGLECWGRFICLFFLLSLSSLLFSRLSPSFLRVGLTIAAFSSVGWGWLLGSRVAGLHEMFPVACPVCCHLFIYFIFNIFVILFSIFLLFYPEDI